MTKEEYRYLFMSNFIKIKTMTREEYQKKIDEIKKTKRCAGRSD